MDTFLPFPRDLTCYMTRMRSNRPVIERSKRGAFGFFCLKLGTFKFQRHYPIHIHWRADAKQNT